MRHPINVCFERHVFRNKSSVFPILFSLEKNNKTLKRPFVTGMLYEPCIYNIIQRFINSCHQTIYRPQYKNYALITNIHHDKHITGITSQWKTTINILQFIGT